LTIFICIAGIFKIPLPDYIVTVWQIAIGFFFAGKISNNATLKSPNGHASWEYLLLISCVLMVGCAINYQEKTFVHADSINSLQYGEVSNITINHEGNWVSW